MARFFTNSSILTDALKNALLFLLLCAFFPLFVIAQTHHTVSPQAQKLYNNAEKLFLYNSNEALKLYHKAIKIDSLFAAPYMRIGQILSMEADKKKQANHYFEHAILLDSNEREFLNMYEILGLTYLQEGNYQQAEKFLKGYLRLSQAPQNKVHKSVQRYLRQCLYAQQNTPQNSVPFTHQKLPKPFNTALSQTYPVLTADLQTFIFTKNNGDEDLNVSELLPSGWTLPQSLSTQINTEASEGTCSISADGQKLVFAACHRPSNIGKCDLYMSHKVGNEWSKPLNLGPTVNSPDWQSHPSFSADGSRLYFSSNRKGGVGGKDIWFTTLDTTETWTAPINLGNNINTEFDEISPFIHSNGITLFFASDGWPSMGGFDMFISKQTIQGWTPPLNLGYPLNDFADQMGFYITPDCLKAFYSYHRKGSYFENNSLISALCEYPLPDTLKKLCPPMFFVKGVIEDKHTHRKLGASIKVSRVDNSFIINDLCKSDDSTGRFLFVVSDLMRTQLEIRKQGYWPQKIHLKDYPISILQNGLWKIALTPISPDSNVILSQAVFESNSAILSPEIHPTLWQLADYLIKNPALRLFIEGHTDDIGTVEYNHKLSLQRADAVKNYLIQKGVKESRLNTKGYGKSHPLVIGTSEIVRQKNRRVECKWIH